MSAIIKPVNYLIGTIHVPGDKSISHRAIILAGLASSPVRVTNFLPAEDCWATAKCMQALGVKVEQAGINELVVKGNGLWGLIEPDDILDAGNSGTMLRLMTGILAGSNFSVC